MKWPKQGRRFLNTDKSLGAFIKWSVAAPAHSGWQNASITLADCSRQITLDFDSNNPSEKKRVLRKLRALQREIVLFAEALESTGQ